MVAGEGRPQQEARSVAGHQISHVNEEFVVRNAQNHRSYGSYSTQKCEQALRRVKKTAWTGPNADLSNSLHQIVNTSENIFDV